MYDGTASIDDDELLRSWRSGDQEAGSVLCERHHDDAWGYARRLARGVGDPDDILAEAYAKVLRAMRRGQGPRDGFRRYLFTAVRSCAFDAHRMHVAMSHEVPDRFDERGFEELHAAGSPMLRALAELPGRSKRVLWMMEVEGRSASEVARMIGSTPGAVSALAYRSRTQLRRRYLSIVSVVDGAPAADLLGAPVAERR